MQMHIVKKEDMKLMKPEGLLWWEITPPRLKRNERPGRPVGGVHFFALFAHNPLPIYLQEEKI